MLSSRYRVVLTDKRRRCRYKKTIICQEVAKAKNVCQVHRVPALSQLHQACISAATTCIRRL